MSTLLYLQANKAKQAEAAEQASSSANIEMVSTKYKIYA